MSQGGLGRQRRGTHCHHHNVGGAITGPHSSSVGTWKARAVLLASVSPGFKTASDPQWAHNEPCEGQDGQVTNVGFCPPSGPLRGNTELPRASSSQTCEVSSSLWTCRDSLPALRPTAGAGRLIKQVGHPKGLACDLHTWKKPAGVGKALLGRKVLHKISSILLVRAKSYKSDSAA